ncbi:MAG: nicotinate (nicotinamide) nucleotide adenylyltransferase [candidate division Zixibacteria bacterium]|nr:nicotinate (nicotinamide) nucleotide adenylyltransferase [candidate division Zixibacteria bacterium]NIS16502.1 nicotinate (nicotinamide) nucleotide adenylyltransferase [candidate division Zixibacteria bacterium]NIS47518.1 nicotinate (nicotinamide) nucleotide adenylyltransferase [candidate division Zixibacteria bacterium]NIT52875.1 nicotinate (nicotinamide) nucleotide adenylyltransferase [candidate division Zixibacteria bacterium]NIU15615.1 nicotinate (nicotinamide) nucleotide adenylyltransfe
MNNKAPLMNGRRNRLGVLGGLFDPIHHGHLSLSRHALEQLQLLKVLLIPTYNPPHREEISDYSHRLKMTEIAVKDKAGLQASAIESHIRGHSYSLKTLRKLKDEFPEFALYFLIGSDNLKKMEDWHKPEEIMRLAQVVMAERPGEEGSAPARFEKKIMKIEMPPVDISSTQIREAVRRGDPIDDYVPEEVAQYIDRNKLYV